MSRNEVPLTSLAPLENTYTDDGPRGTTSELGLGPPHSPSPYTVVMAFLIIICISAFVANLAMLISLLLQRRAARKTVNIFICNQTVLDLVATTVSAVKLSLIASGYLNKKTSVLRMLLIHEVRESDGSLSLLDVDFRFLLMFHCLDVVELLEEDARSEAARVPVDRERCGDVVSHIRLGLRPGRHHG